MTTQTANAPCGLDATTGATLPSRPIQELTCTGTPYEMGLCQGEAFRNEIRSSLETVKGLEAVRLMRPRLLPHRLFLLAAEDRARRFLKRAFAVAPLAADQRLQGIARGASVPLRKLALCCALEAVLSDLTQVTAPAVNAGCSALAVAGGASKTDEPILAHNFDYLPSIQPFYFMRRSHPSGGLRSVELSLMPMPGVVDGINEAGLSITCNYAFAVDTGSTAPTITMLIGEALARLRTVEEAIAWFRATPRVGGGLLMLGDESGRIAALDISNTQLEVRHPERDRLFHTNRYCADAMGRVELSDAAVYSERSPAVLRGRRVHQSGEARQTRFEQLLADIDALDPGTIQAVMSDHGAEGSPTNDTICMHGNYWHTTASLQLLPKQRAIRASFSPTCVAEYREFGIG